MSGTSSATTDGRRPIVVALVLLVLLLTAAPASARWAATGTGSGKAVARTLPAPTKVTATCAAVLLPRGIDVTWVAATPAVPGTTYDVARSADRGATWTTVATGLTATSLNDRPTSAGSVRYRVTAQVGGWSRQAAADSGSRTLLPGLLCL